MGGPVREDRTAPGLEHQPSSHAQAGEPDAEQEPSH